MTEQEDAKSWNYLVSNFPDTDFKRLEYIALKEVGKEVIIRRFG